MLLAIVLVLSIVACFLPWLKMDAAILGEEQIKRDIYGYDYIVPLGAPYTAPVAILSVIGFILSAYSFKRIQRIRILNVVAGILILVGVIASFGYTASVAFADVFEKGGSFNAWGDYGMGLEALFGLLMIIIGALQKPRVLMKQLLDATKLLRGLARPTAESAVAVLIGLLIGALFMIASGYDPVTAYSALFKGAFGSLSALAETLSFATPLMLTAITFAVGVKSGLFNIGAEGQLYVGAIGAVAVGGAIALPAGLHIAAATVSAMFFGVLWALPVALLKIWRGAHEVISTIMLNWVARFLVIYIAIYLLARPGSAEKTLATLPSARYSLLMSGASLTTVIFVAMAFCIGVYILLWGTKLGYELRLVGTNPDAAHYAGVNTRRAILLSFVIGGLAAGLAGATQVLGRPAWCLYATLGNVIGLGFAGIGIALIGRNHPIGGIFASVFYGGMLHGGRYMEYVEGVCSELVVGIQGVIIIALATPAILSILRRRFK